MLEEEEKWKDTKEEKEKTLALQNTPVVYNKNNTFQISSLLFFIVLFVYFVLFYILLKDGEWTFFTGCIVLFSWVHSGFF